MRYGGCIEHRHTVSSSMMRDDFRSELAIGLAAAGVLPIAVAAALVGVRGEIINANVALALVVTVVISSVIGGWQAGTVAALVSALSYDFFFTRPYLSLSIASQDDVETTALLLVVGLIVGVVAARGRRSRASAESGQADIRRIHRVAEQAVAGTPAEDVILSAQRELTELLSLDHCRFEAPPYAEVLPRLERSGVVSGVHERRLTQGEFELPPQGVELVVLARGEPVGRFVLMPKPHAGISLEQRVVAVAIVDQVGGAIASHSRPWSS
jgi:hypothetical protein